MKKANPYIYLKSHLDQFSTKIMLSTKIEFSEVDGDEERNKRQLVVSETQNLIKAITIQELRTNLKNALTIIQEMENIHNLQLRQQRIQQRQKFIEDPQYKLDPTYGEITELNLIPAKIFTHFEAISNKTKNINAHLHIVKMMDIIMSNKWYSIGDKDTWTLIYLVNYIFDIHDIFVGSYIAERLVRNARYILMSVLEGRSHKLNQE